MSLMLFRRSLCMLVDARPAGLAKPLPDSSALSRKERRQSQGQVLSGDLRPAMSAGTYSTTPQIVETTSRVRKVRR